MYAIDRSGLFDDSCNLILAKNKFVGISQKQSSGVEPVSGKTSKAKQVKKELAESDSEMMESDIDTDMVDFDFTRI